MRWLCFRVQLCPSTVWLKWFACNINSSLIQFIFWTLHCFCILCEGACYSWLLIYNLVAHIGTRLRLLAIELLSTAGPLCRSQCLFGTILVILFLMVLTWLVLRAEPMPLYCSDLVLIFVSFYFLSFLHSTGWLCGVGVFRLIVFVLSPRLWLPTPF